MKISQLPYYMSSMAGSALKRASEAIGYNKSCTSQGLVEKTLPAAEELHGLRTDNIELTERTVSDAELDTPALTPPRLNQPEFKQRRTKISYSANRKLARQRRRARQKQSILSRKVPQQSSWAPKQLVRAYLEKLTQEERQELAQTLIDWVQLGKHCAMEWVFWNTPKIVNLSLNLLAGGDGITSLDDHFELVDTLKATNRL